MRLSFLGLILLLFPVGFCGCSTIPSQPNSAHDPLAISISVCGGEEGTCTIYTANRNGDIYNIWTVYGDIVREKLLTCRNKALAEDILKTVETYKLENISMHEGANIRYNINLKFASREPHYVSWWKHEPNPEIDMTSSTT